MRSSAVLILISASFTAAPLGRSAITAAGPAAAVLESIRTITIDPDACYRVRDLTLRRGDVRFYLTDGFLAFSKPVAGAPVAAVFSSAVDAGDGEVMLIPPNRDERVNLAAKTHAPNLDEHLNDAVFYFADDTAAELQAQMKGSEWIHRDPAKGAELAARYSPVVSALAPQFATFMLLDLMTPERQKSGYFAAILGGKTLGAFEVTYNPRAPEPVLAGKMQGSGSSARFEIWTSYRPKSAAPAAPEFAASQFKIDARIDRALHMRVVSRFTVHELTHDLHALDFNLSRQMRVVSVEVDGQPAEFATQVGADDGDESDKILVLVPGEALKKGVDHEVAVTHEGDVITAGPSGTYFVGSRGRWYPHRPVEFAQFDLTFHFPSEFDLVAPGEPIRDAVEGDTRVIERRVDAPIPFAGFNFGHYRRSTVVRDGFTVELCANAEAPGDLDARAADISDVMAFYTERFGPPPLRRLEVSPIPATFGQGFAGLIYLSTYAYAAPGDLAAATPETRVFFTQLMQAHEAAHQWWGNIVTTVDYHDEWIMEALANYSAMEYLRHTVGKAAVDSLMEAYRRELLAPVSTGVSVESTGPLTQGRRLEAEGKSKWTAILYGKGTWVVQMLAARMGDGAGDVSGNGAFWKMLAELRRRYAFRAITTDQFRQLCAEFMPADAPDRQLVDFFDQWVSSTGVPKLKLSSKVTKTPHGTVVSGTLTQTDVPEDFSADFPVTITAGGSPVVRWIHSSSQDADFRWTFNQSIGSITLDPAGSFLRR
ncbi:M1 family metallopeptidase [Nevskia soli]|uniref:M1 family metallopeptidase n=1 Tax=Nevskia soli TaxID=418856 RepID=UPI0015D72B80|nr:M1 family aminopeptidase [Nevskia soli]